MQTITPYISAKSADAVIDFCAKVFGAKETMRQTDDAGVVRHSQITIGDSTIMLSDDLFRIRAEWSPTVAHPSACF